MKSVAITETKASIAWTRASIPDYAVSFFGMSITKSIMTFPSRSGSVRALARMVTC